LSGLKFKVRLFGRPSDVAGTRAGYIPSVRLQLVFGRPRS